MHRSSKAAYGHNMFQQGKAVALILSPTGKGLFIVTGNFGIVAKSEELDTLDPKQAVRFTESVAFCYTPRHHVMLVCHFAVSIPFWMILASSFV